MIEITKSGSFNFISIQYNMDDVNALMKIYISTKILEPFVPSIHHMNAINMDSNGNIKSERVK